MYLKSSALARLVLPIDTYLHAVRVAHVIPSDEGKTVAMLHDVVEDTMVTFLDLEDFGFTDEVIDAVRALTRPETATYRKYIFDLIIHGGLALEVKKADLADNLRRATRRPSLEKRYLRALADIEAAS